MKKVTTFNLTNSMNLTIVFTLYFHGCHVISGLPHTQGTQGIQGNSGNFQVKENLRETQGISGNFDLFFKLRETQGSFDFF